MKKIVIFYIASILASVCLAADEEQLAQLALEQVQADLSAFSEVLGSCKESESILPKDVFSGLSLSMDQKKLVIMYHAAKANYECAKPALNQYLISASIFAHYNPEKAEDLTKGNTLVTYDAIKAFELGQQYNELPSTIREKLGKIDSLNKPFDMMLSADNLGMGI